MFRRSGSDRFPADLIGRATKGTTDAQLRKGLTGLAEGLAQESERLATP